MDSRQAILPCPARTPFGLMQIRSGQICTGQIGRTGHGTTRVEKSLSTLPFLRIMRAVLPHTALQSIVSSSRSARFCAGFIHCEKSHNREVGIGPLLMIQDTVPPPFF